MQAGTPQTLLVALALGAVHLFSGKLRFLDVTPRSVWLSTAGGVSVAYVFLHILPDLAEAQERFPASSWLTAIERHVWLLSLAGLTAFYGLEWLVRESKIRHTGNEQPTGRRAFWLHIGSFTVYNALIGYLLHSRDTQGKEFLFFALAIALHFVVNDYGLRQDHRHSYDRVGRWLLAVAVMAGWALGTYVNVHELGIAAIFAIMAGGIILNVLKEELPEERRSRFWAFAVGAGLYAGLLLMSG